jgi:hypothetical protein
MSYKLLLAILWLSAPFAIQSPIDCKPCNCATYPQPSDVCTLCCFVITGVVTEAGNGEVTILPSTLEPKPSARKFKLPPKTPTLGKITPGADATLYYHRVGDQDVVTRIEITNYIGGQLTPDSQPTPADNECSGIRIPSEDSPEGSTRVFLGKSGAVALRYPFVALRIDDENIITILRTTAGMLVSARLFDADGRLAAQIIDNHFFVNTKNAYRLQISSDHHSLNISGGGNVSVEIQFLNRSTISILGKLYGPHGTYLDVEPDDMRVNGRDAHLRGICAVGGKIGIELTVQTK